MIELKTSSICDWCGKTMIMKQEEIKISRFIGYPAVIPGPLARYVSPIYRELRATHVSYDCHCGFFRSSLIQNEEDLKKITAEESRIKEARKFLDGFFDQYKPHHYSAEQARSDFYEYKKLHGVAA